MPGVQAETVPRTGLEHPSILRTEAVYQNEDYIGEIVYVRRKTKTGTLYGWRPAKAAPQARLTTQVEAIQRLPKYHDSSSDGYPA